MSLVSCRMVSILPGAVAGMRHGYAALRVAYSSCWNVRQVVGAARRFSAYPYVVIPDPVGPRLGPVPGERRDACNTKRPEHERSEPPRRGDPTEGRHESS